MDGPGADDERRRKDEKVNNFSSKTYGSSSCPPKSLSFQKKKLNCKKVTLTREVKTIATAISPHSLAATHTHTHTRARVRARVEVRILIAAASFFFSRLVPFFRAFFLLYELHRSSMLAAAHLLFL